jgi:hypothetical protein
MKEKTAGGGRGVRCSLQDLPPHLQKQAAAQLGLAAPASAPVVAAPARRGPSKTEMEYERRFLAGAGARFEGVSFRMANGHRYTPDWVVCAAGRLTCHEVKGGFRLGSYQRARLAFDQAKVEFPDVTWVWAEKRNGEWRVQT